MAHEINTPIQFVGDNLVFLGESFEQVGQLHSLYERLVENCGNTKVASELCHQIRQYGEEIDIEFLREELGVAIQQSSDGIKRVADIVKAMKEFSHPGSQKKTAIDVNSAIETTITVSRNEWKYVAVVETDLAPQLPLAAGYPGDLNQAILNILVNAAHAIEEKNAGNDQRGLIQCTTALVDRFIEIRISDSGCGMPLDVQKRIFDPFFTTKDVGKGTGQGLSIIYSVIVEKHGGEIRVESIPDEGTTFILRVPMVETSNNVAVNENANTLCR